MNIFRAFWDWILVRDYDHDIELAVSEINTRQIRGNILAQDGDVLESHDLDTLAITTDKAMDLLAVRLKRAA